MLERAYSVTSVHPSLSAFRDGVSNLHLSFSGISNLSLSFSFFMWGGGWGGGGEVVSFVFWGFFLAHLSKKLRVSYCHHPMSVVRRSSSTISLLTL